MANWNLSKRLFMGVGSLVVLLLVSGAVSFITGRSMKAQLDSGHQADGASAGAGAPAAA
jgi:hypothetical protein